MGWGSASFVYKIKNRHNNQESALKVIEKKGNDIEKLAAKIKKEKEVF